MLKGLDGVERVGGCSKGWRVFRGWEGAENLHLASRPCEIFSPVPRM